MGIYEYRFPSMVTNFFETAAFAVADLDVDGNWCFSFASVFCTRCKFESLQCIPGRMDYSRHALKRKSLLA